MGRGAVRKQGVGPEGLSIGTRMRVSSSPLIISSHDLGKFAGLSRPYFLPREMRVGSSRASQRETWTRVHNLPDPTHRSVVGDRRE